MLVQTILTQYRLNNLNNSQFEAPKPFMYKYSAFIKSTKSRFGGTIVLLLKVLTNLANFSARHLFTKLSMAHDLVSLNLSSKYLTSDGNTMTVTDLSSGTLIFFADFPLKEIFLGVGPDSKLSILLPVSRLVSSNL